MATLDQFYSIIEPRVGGCPRPLIMNELTQLLQDFFSFSRIWQEDVTIASVGLAQMPLTIPPPAGTRVLEVIDVKVNDAFLDSRTLAALRAWSPDWQLMEGPDSFFFTAYGQSQIAVIPAPNPPSDVIATCALTLAANASPTSTIPDDYFAEYSMGISDGVTARLLLMPNKAWSAPTLAPGYAAGYASARMGARVASNLGFTGAPMRASLRRTY